MTPVVLSFDGRSPELLTEAPNRFDLGGAVGTTSDWPTARTPWLVRDVDGNGMIDDGRELFGSMTSLGGERRAANGFEALGALDANGDLRLSADDPAFFELRLWRDEDADRRSTASELITLQSAGVVSIDLDHAALPSCDDRGNCVVERASFRYLEGDRAATGAALDIHLASRAP